MKFRKLGKSDLILSEIGLGTWAIGGGDWGMGWGDQTKSDSKAAIFEALESGVNWIDTAHAYGFGLAEEVVGEVISDWKDEVIVATKCGVLPQSDLTPRRYISPSSIRDEIEGSLSRLKVDRIDLYQIHWPTPLENLRDSWESMVQLQREGKVRCIGVCNCSLNELNEIGEMDHLVSNQPMYSMLEQTIEDDLLDWSSANSVGILAYSPMHSGLLTGKVSVAWLNSLPENDWRKHKVDHPAVKHLHQGQGMSRFLELQDELGEIASSNDRNIAQLAVSWVLRKQEITSAIVGARKSGQIYDAIEAVNKPLSREEDALINQAICKYMSKEND